MFFCDLCDYRNNNSQYVRYHKEVAYKCKTGDYRYKSRWPNDLKIQKYYIHLKIWYTCQICDITTGAKLNLYQHQYNVYQIINENKCDICEKVFCKSSTLMAHKCNTDGIYKCEICKEEKKTSDSLASHMATIHLMGPKALKKM